MQLPYGAPIIESIRKCTPINKLKFYQLYALFITYLLYVVYHVTRRPLSIVKSVLHHQNCSYNANTNSTHWCDWAPFDTEDAKTLLGLLDSSYLISYALFLFMAGYIAERSNMRYYMIISLFFCGFFCGVLGFAYYLKIHVLYFFIIIQIINGIAQSSGWPAVLSTVGKWCGSHKKGLVFGIWNSHGYIGNIVGAAVAGVFVETHWELSFIIPGLISFGAAILAFLFLIPNPQDVGLSLENDEEKYVDKIKNNIKSEGQSAISFFEALKIPGVIEFSISLFFAKIVSYTFLYWLPLYIAESTKSSSEKSAFLSISFDIGSCFGAIIAGYISDKSGASAITCISMYMVSIPSLLVYNLFGTKSTVLNEILQFNCGIFVNGPYSLIMTAVTTELGTKVKSKSALATVTGIVVGTGGIGGAAGPALSGIVSKQGWNKVFYMIMISDLLAAISLLRIAYKEFLRLKTKTPTNIYNLDSYNKSNSFSVTT